MQIRPGWGHQISLRSLLPEVEVFGADDVYVGSCSCDTRTLKRGDLFAALPGRVCDGHSLAAEAERRGCRAILAQRPLVDAKVPVCLVPDTREAYGRVCQALAGDPSRRLKVIGVTGTNGKTTTSCLIASMLVGARHKVGLLGTLGYFDGEDYEDPTLTTPPAEKLAALLARMVNNGCSHAVMEVSSHALAQSRLAGVEVDAACITNVSRDHLDYHPTIQDYRLTKSKILTLLSGEGFAVINADDPISAGYLCQIDGPVLTVGIRSPAEITAKILEQCISEQTFLLTAGSETVPVRTRMIGTHHVYNCLTAAAAGLTYGLDLTTVVSGLEAVDHVPGRLQRVECGQPFAVFVDYAHTPDALAACLQTLREVVDGQVICVFGAGGERDKQKRPLMGRAVEIGADQAVLTNDNPRSEDPRTISGQILDGFRNPTAVAVFQDRAEAICWALDKAQPGDCVLIAGKGHENYQIVGDERFHFDDYEVARNWLYEFQPHAMPKTITP